ncbi:hypothetical protein Droror1_Dr00025413 [Drosera rotundifolia]
MHRRLFFPFDSVSLLQASNNIMGTRKFHKSKMPIAGKACFVDSLYRYFKYLGTKPSENSLPRTTVGWLFSIIESAPAHTPNKAKPPKNQETRQQPKHESQLLHPSSFSCTSKSSLNSTNFIRYLGCDSEVCVNTSNHFEQHLEDCKEKS